MSELSFHQISIPVFMRGLEVIATELEIASASAAARGFPPDVLVSARLYPDMLPLAGQVQRASDTAKFSAERLSGVASPRFEDKEQTVAELIARARNTIEFLRGIGPEHFEQMVGKPITVQLGTFSREDYLLQFALPNFFFHVSTIHAILRNNGVVLGKLDYLGLKKP